MKSEVKEKCKFLNDKKKLLCLNLSSSRYEINRYLDSIVGMKVYKFFNF